MIINTKERYGAVAQLFHWLVALLIFALIPMGIYMSDLPQSSEAEIDQKLFLYSLHKSVGLALLAVATLRIVWALFNKKPVPLYPERTLETIAAETIHWVLYGAIILIPLSGWFYHAATDGFAPIWWFDNQNIWFIPKSQTAADIFITLHFLFTILMGLSILAHIAGALKHFIIDKDGTLHRMLPSSRKITLPTRMHNVTKLPLILAMLAFMTMGLGGVIAAVYFEDDERLEDINLTSVASDDGVSWAVRQDESSLTIETIQGGSSVKGVFQNWNAAILFDPKNLDSSVVEATIDISSLELGGNTKQALSSDFLNAEGNPIAIFRTEKFFQLDPNHYQAEGTLELNGVTQNFVLPFELNIVNRVATMNAAIALNRMDYNIGAGGFTNESSVNFEVKIVIDIVADQMELG